MKLEFFKKAMLFCIIITLFSASSLHAQLNKVFQSIIGQVLKDDLKLTPGVHRNNFITKAEDANTVLTPALNTLIATNIASFPLSSTVAGVTFDFSRGQPLSISESLGPIFAETAQTLGKGKMNIGFNYTYLSLSKFRGLATKDIRFTFIHDDVGAEGLGDIPFESDTIDLFFDLDINASILASFVTVGITNNFDVGVAIPIVNVSLSGEARAVINSFTFGFLGAAAHRFNNEPTPEFAELNPDLEDIIGYDESANGLGDIAIRLKYSFLRGTNVDLAAMLDIKVPTGDKNDFLGTGKTNSRFVWIMSKKVGGFTSHLNVGYERRTADRDSDEFEFVAGFDQKLASGLTVAFDILGELDLDDDEAIELFPGTTTLRDRIPNGESVRQVDLSNIPERDNDNSISASFGFRYAASEKVIFLGNILIPLNDGGLRSTVAATYGVTVSL